VFPAPVLQLPRLTEPKPAVSDMPFTVTPFTGFPAPSLTVNVIVDIAAGPILFGAAEAVSAKVSGVKHFPAALHVPPAGGLHA
jgi:hypothetical protein